MTEVYARVLLWHKLIAMQTGGMALCAAKHRLNQTEARGWVDAFRNVADDIEKFLTDRTFVLDDKGQRVVGSPIASSLAEGTAGTKASTTREGDHVEPGTSRNVPHQAPVPRKAGGLRVATRKKQT